MHDDLLLASGRLYSCLRCHELVVVCRKCDRGNLYCFGGCSQIRRMESKRRASRNYQSSIKGKLKHAECEARRRARKKVTDQGSHETEDRDSLVIGDRTEPEVECLATEELGTVDSPISGEAKAVEPGEAVKVIQEMQYCRCCGSCCGTFLRLEPWQGGRYFKRARGLRHDNSRRHRGRDSPSALRREVEKEHNS